MYIYIYVMFNFHYIYIYTHITYINIIYIYIYNNYNTSRNDLPTIYPGSIPLLRPPAPSKRSEPTCDRGPRSPAQSWPRRAAWFIGNPTMVTDSY